MIIRYFVHKYDSYGEWLGDVGFFEDIVNAIDCHKHYTKHEHWEIE